MRRIAVIAGQGDLPLQLAQKIRLAKAEPVIFAVAGQADSDFSDFETHAIALGAIGRTRTLLGDVNCSELVMAGKIVRPPLSQLKPDAAAVGLLARAIGKGDDALLRVISDYFAEAGIETLSTETFMPQAVMPEGVIVGEITQAVEKDIHLGSAALESLGHHDVGQGIVVQDQRVLAIEAAEGTDRLLERVGDLIDPGGTPAVFIKRPKTGQDVRLDQPVIGVQTLRHAAQAGIGVVALEADGVLLSGSPQDLWRLAEELKLTVVGI